LPNTRRERKVRLLKEEDVTTESSLDMEDRPSLSSERKQKPPRKSLSDCSAPSAKPEEL
jgi:hypothetical protein